MKKFTTLLICLLMFVTCGLAGCAGFTINKVKYYNEVLAVVGETEITRHELLVAYNSYGQNYFVSQGNQTEKDALNSTLDLLIDRESLYQYARANDATYRPSEYQVNNAITDIFESLDTSMDKYISTAKKIFNIKSEDQTEEETTDPTEYSLDDYKYTKRAEVLFDGEEYYISYIIEEEDDFDCIINNDNLLSDFENSEIITDIMNSYLADLQERLRLDEEDNAQAIYDKVLSLFAKDLIEYERYLRNDGKAYNQETNDLIYRFIERTFESEIKSLYLENIRTHYLKTEKLSMNKLITKYNALVNKSVTMYDEDHETYKKEIKDIGTKGDTILYHPTLTDGTKFGYFIHTLISFSEDQKTAIKNADNIIKESDRLASIANTISETESIKRDVSFDEETGAKIYTEGDKTATIDEIIAEYEKIYNKPNDSERLDAFLDFMFTYNTDPGSMSAGMPYVVGNNGFSGMEQAFTDESVALMTAGEVGAMSNPHNDNNKIDFNKLCVSSYGIHFIMYIGDVNAFDINPDANVYIETENRANDTVGHNLYTKELNPLTGESYFDMLFDEVYPASNDEVYTSNTGYSDEEERLIGIIQKTNPVKKYTTKIKATKTRI
ncbi:MAG: hypothetical protein IKC49_00345 [Clostridia bacterium]|nr:hypothetical protein [Clostridia bacterium]